MIIKAILFIFFDHDFCPIITVINKIHFVIRFRIIYHNFYFLLSELIINFSISQLIIIGIIFF